MKRLFVGIITALCAIAVTAQLVPYRQLSTNQFKAGSFPAVELRLNPTQFNTGGFPITITNVTGVFGAGGGSGITNLPANAPGYLTNNGSGTLSWVAGSGGGSGNVVASGTNDVGWLLTASTNDGVHGVWTPLIRITNGVVSIGDGVQQAGEAFTFSHEIATVENQRAMWFSVTLSGTNTLIYPYEIDILDDGYTGGDSNGFFVYSALDASTNNNTGSVIYLGNGIYSIVGQVTSASSSSDGQSVAVYGNNFGEHATNFAVVGFSYKSHNDELSVGTVGSVHDYGFSGNSIGGYFETSSLNFDDPNLNTNAALLLDSRDSGYPIIVGRTNNGTQVFAVVSSGAIITADTLTTGDPGSGTAAWKLGNILSVSGTNVTFQIQIGGTNITVSGHL